MVFSVPINSTNEIQPLFKLIELEQEGDLGDKANEVEVNPHVKELRSYLKDCGISHTTLEEVFMKVTGKKVSKFIKKDDRKVDE